MRRYKKLRSLLATALAVLVSGGLVAFAPPAAAAEDADWCLSIQGCESKTDWYQIEYMEAVHFPTGAALRVQLNTRLNGRHAYPTLYVQHKDGYPVTLTNVHIDCKRHVPGFPDSNCGSMQAGGATVPTVFLGGTWTAGEFRSDYLRRKGTYHLKVEATLTVNGHMQGHTLIESMEWECDSTLPQGSPFELDEDNCHFIDED